MALALVVIGAVHRFSYAAGMLDVVYLGASFAFARFMFGTFRRREMVSRYM
jgi:hypothetical protein